MNIEAIRNYESTNLFSEMDHTKGTKRFKKLWFKLDLVTQKIIFCVSTKNFPMDENEFTFTDLESAVNLYTRLSFTV